jgi:hypothetical protein
MYSVKDAAYDAAVYGDPATPDIEDLQQIILIGVPEKDHIVDARADDRKDHDPDGRIPVGIRILPRLFCHVRSHDDAGQHRCGKDAAIKGDGISANIKGLRHILQIDPEVRESNIHFTHYIRHILSSPPGGQTLKRNRQTSPSCTM